MFTVIVCFWFPATLLTMPFNQSEFKGPDIRWYHAAYTTATWELKRGLAVRLSASFTSVHVLWQAALRRHRTLECLIQQGITGLDNTRKKATKWSLHNRLGLVKCSSIGPHRSRPAHLRFSHRWPFLIRWLWSVDSKRGIPPSVQPIGKWHQADPSILPEGTSLFSSQHLFKMEHGEVAHDHACWGASRIPHQAGWA